MRLFTLVAFGLAVVASQAADEPRKGADVEFVLKASAGGLGEVNQGMLAAKAASSAEVRKFATQMVTDHTKANKELIALANKKRLRVAAEMKPEARAMSEKLAAMRGTEFDRAYMERQVKDHEETVALFEKEAKGGEDADLKQWASDTLPTLKMHLKMARMLSKDLAGGKDAKAAPRD